MADSIYMTTNEILKSRLADAVAEQHAAEAGLEALVAQGGPEANPIAWSRAMDRRTAALRAQTDLAVAIRLA